MSDNHATIVFDTKVNIESAKASIDALQQKFKSFKFDPKFDSKINKEFETFNKAYDIYKQKLSTGIKTQGDYNAVVKSLSIMKSSMVEISKVSSQIEKTDPLKAFRGDDILQNLDKQIAEIQNKIKNFKIDSKQLSNLFDVAKVNISPSNTKIPALMEQIEKSNKAGDFEATSKGLSELETQLERSRQRYEDLAATQQAAADKAKAQHKAYKETADSAQQYAEKAQKLEQVLQELATLNPANLSTFRKELEDLLGQRAERGEELSKSFHDFTGEVQKSQTALEKTADSLAKVHKEEFGMNRQIEMIDRQVQSYFGLSQILRKVVNIGKQAMQTVKELDAAMTQTAVVTNFSVSDMWEKLPQYTATANQLGSTIKDVYEATTLYYQQGLNTDQAMGVATETLKMARIGGLQAAEATDMMTAALRGFNMQINELSAQRINDVYSKLAAITASNTKELGEAMTRTASIANSAGMEFETTSAFLAQMIETTREAPENLGTAMKTIVARFQEMKKSPTDLIDSEGEILDANRVEKALKTVGIALRDTEGNFRDLDQVFLEIAEKWDSLSMGQQRYIATMAAGSRQQSRFIAMMSNYERTMELVDAANNSAGASQEQFDKTLESMAAKLNMFKNAWDAFTMGLMNDKWLKGLVDGATGFLTVINKIIDTISGMTGPFKGVTKSILTLGTVMGGLTMARKGINTGVEGVFNWWSGKTSLTQSIRDISANGTLAGSTYASKVVEALHGGHISEAIKEQFGAKVLDELKNKDNYVLAKTNAEGIVPTVADQMTAMQKGDLAINTENLASIEGGLLQSLSQNEEFRKLGAEEGMRQVHEYVQALGEQWSKAGTAEGADAAAKAQEARKQIASTVGEEGLQQAAGNKAMVMSAGLQDLTKSATQAGSAFSQLGYILQGTPLAAFGTSLTMVGRLMTGVIGVATGMGNAFTSLISGISVLTGATTAEAIAQEKSNVAKIKAAWANGALLSSLVPLIPIFIAIAAAVALIVLAYMNLTEASRTLEKLHTQAAAAADRFSEMKQATSELTDSLDKLSEYDTAFESLVSGTAEFNQKLIESNELVTDLIKKYPMLEENGYITTDQNGRMNITQAGREAIKEEQTEKQARAQAIDIFANNDYKRQQATMTEEYKKAEQTEQKVWNEIGFASLDFDKKREAILAEMKARGETSTADLIAKVDAQTAIAQKQAVASMLSTQKDLLRKETVSEVLGNNYQQILDSITADLSGTERAKTYAEAYGYEYISGNKFKDASGKEIEIEKTVWNDETTNKRIKANDQMIDSAVKVDAALTHLDSAASEVFDNLNSNSLISDILSNNINTNREDLQNMLDSKQLKELVNQMSDADIEALKAAGIDDAKAFIEERAKAIQDAQKQQDADLATMLARSSGLSAEDLLSNTREASEQIQYLRNQLNSLSQEQKSFSAEVGKSLEEAFGTDTSDKFINSFIHSSEEAKKEFQSIFEDVDWSSSIDALGAIEDAVGSAIDEVSNFGEAIYDSMEASHLLNDAMQELYAAEDFTNALDNLDSFVDASGRLSAVGIEKMAEESSTLAKMLDTGAISAGGLAAAINATSVDGVSDITDLSDSVLKLLGYLGQLEDSAARSHDYIENFNPGIDTGESKDFVIENIEKIDEFVKAGEWGNEQLHNYIQSIIGTEAWDTALRQSGQNYQKAYEKVKNQINFYSKGYDKLWLNFSKDLDAFGDKLDNKKIFKELGWDKGIEFTENNGQLELRLNGHDLEDLNTYIQKVAHVGREQADNIIQDWRNYSPQFDQQVREQGFNKGLQTQEFQNAHEYNGQLVLTKSELETFANITNDTRKNTRIAIENADEQGRKVIENKTQKGKEGKHYFDNTEGNGELRIDYKPMAQEFNKYLGLKGKKSFALQDEFATTNQKGQTGYDVEKVIAGYFDKGFSQLQSEGMAFEQMKENKDQTYMYKGHVVDPSQFSNATEFLESLTEIDQNIEWENIGHAIAEGIISYIKGENEAYDENNPNNQLFDYSNTPAYTGGLREEDEGMHYVPGVGYVKDGTGEVVNRKKGAFGQYTEAEQNQIIQNAQKNPFFKFTQGLAKQDLSGFKNLLMPSWLSGIIGLKEVYTNPKGNGINDITKGMLSAALPGGTQELLKTISNLLISEKSYASTDKTSNKNMLSREEAIAASGNIDRRIQKDKIIQASINAIKELSPEIGNTMQKGFDAVFATKQKYEAQQSKNPQIPKGMEQVFNPKTGLLEYKKVQEGADETANSLNGIAKVTEGVVTGFKGLASFIKTLTGGNNKTGKPNVASEGNKRTGFDLIHGTGNGTATNTGVSDQQAILTINADYAQVTEAKTEVQSTIDLANTGATLKISTNSSGIDAEQKKLANMEKKASKNTKGGKVEFSTSVNKAGADQGIKEIVAKANKTVAKVRVKSVKADGAYSAINELKSYAQETVSFGVDVKKGNKKNFTVTVKADVLGQNNTGHVPSLPNLGSLATGNTKPRTGRLGPKGKGGLTLTGELGYEVAWLPSQGKSMILGAKGPEMVNLPGDAVVWNHEQSKEIVKKKQIPSGTAAVGAGSAYDLSTRKLITDNSYVQQQIKSKEKGKGASSKDKSNAKKSNKKLSNDWKLKKEIGSTNVLIYNTEKKIEQVQNNIESIQKKINKALEKSSTILSDVTKNVTDEVKQLQLSYALNTKLAKLYNNRLKKADKSNKKKDKVDIKWSDTYQKKGKKGKKETKTKRKKASISLSKYITYDEATGAYQLNQKELNKVYKKNKNKGKAIREAAEKAINDNTSKRDSATKAAEEAKEKLEELGKQLYDTFFGWENELTKILKLTNQIATAESKISAVKEMQSLSEAMLSSGLQKATKDFAAQTIKLFDSQAKMMAKQIGKRTEAIKEQQNVINKAVSSQDEKDFVKKLEERSEAMDAAVKADEKEAKAKAKVEKDQKKIDKYNDLIKKSKGKTRASAIKKEKANIKDANKDIKKEKDNIKKLKNKLKNAKTKKDKEKIQKQIDAAEKRLQKYENKKKTATSNLKFLQTWTSDKLDAQKGNDQDKYSKAQKVTNAAKAELERLGLNATQYTEADILANSASLEEAKERLKEVQQAQQYITATKNADGTYSLDLDEEQLEADKEAGYISEKMYEAIKKYYEDANEANDTLINLYEEQISALEEMYSSLADLKQQYADYADELQETLEQIDQDNLNKMQKLFDSLNNHLKNLLDDVKKKLDQRRQLEDNAKTEDDINKKLQRLATLRADTSGGHAAEILQLEKEVADAQQSYGRTLEDQLLSSLEEQADEAAKQRERQIEIAQAQLEVNKTTGLYAQQVNELLDALALEDNTEAIQQVRDLLLYGTSPQNKARAEITTNEIEGKVNGLVTLPDRIESLTEQIQQTNADLEALQKAIEGMGDLVTGPQNNSIAFLKEQQRENKNAQEAFDAAVAAYKNEEIEEEPTLQDLATVYGAKGFKEANISAKAAIDSGALTAEKLKEGGYTAEDFATSGVDYDIAKSVFSLNEMAKGGYTLNDKDAYTNKIANAASNKKIGEKEFLSVASLAKKAGYGVGKFMTDLVNTGKLTWKQVFTAADKAGYSKQHMALSFTSSDQKAGFNAAFGKGAWDKYYKKAKNNKKLKKYAFLSGGFADFTGPAWLDGTRAKPEAVLSATDTKNFIQLRDVLSDVMGSISSVSTTENNPVTYDIDINVDHIANDYDVDRIAERIEKKIVHDASYRNVTVVRALR